jgi:hypothetical protein
MASPTVQTGFAELLKKAVAEPGILSKAYSQFHNYSLGNILLAAFQCAAGQIPIGPMATFQRWKELGRWVRKGEKAITLCQPVTIRKAAEQPNGQDAEEVSRTVGHTMTGFGRFSGLQPKNLGFHSQLGRPTPSAWRSDRGRVRQRRCW